MDTASESKTEPSQALVKTSDRLERGFQVQTNWSDTTCCTSSGCMFYTHKHLGLFLYFFAAGTLCSFRNYLFSFALVPDGKSKVAWTQAARSCHFPNSCQHLHLNICTQIQNLRHRTCTVPDPPIQLL